MAEHYDIEDERRQRSIPGGAGNGFDGTLRRVEIDMATVKTEVKNIDKNMATKKDISDLKVWILVGVLGAIPVGVGIATLVIRAFPGT